MFSSLIWRQKTSILIKKYSVEKGKNLITREWLLFRQLCTRERAHRQTHRRNRTNEKSGIFRILSSKVCCKLARIKGRKTTQHTFREASTIIRISISYYHRMMMRNRLLFLIRRRQVAISLSLILTSRKRAIVSQISITVQPPYANTSKASKSEPKLSPY